MSLKLTERAELVNGKWDARDRDDRTPDSPFSGVTLEGVNYVKLSGQPQESAIVVLRYDTGGTQYHYWVYVYGSSGGAPRLLGFFHAGDRAYYGLDRVSVKEGLLVVDLYDPDKREGDCCSDGYIRYRFRWNGNGFEVVGSATKGKVDLKSRRPVSVFGLPLDPQ